MDSKTYIVVSRKNIEGKSDYGVCGAFSNKAEAESYIEKNKENATFAIAEMEK